MKTKFNLLLCLFIAVLAAILGACSSDEPELPGAPEPVRRTVLVYIAANNSLGAYNFDNDDIREMLRGSQTGQLPADTRWLVYHAGTFGTPALMEIKNGATDTLRTYASGLASTYDGMTAVFDDMAEVAPARAYGLVLWSHGSGWVANGLDENISPEPYEDNVLRPLSFGDDGGKRMNIATLRAAIKDRGFDYIYFDACHMGGVEVMYELRDAVRYVVCGPAETPGAGMPYDKNMSYLADGSLEALVEAAKTTFSIYNGYSNDCAMTVVDLAGLEALAQATARIYSHTPLPHPGSNVTNYYGTVRADKYIDFGEYVCALADAAGLDVSEFNEALADVVVYCDAPERFWSDAKRRYLPIYHASGLSTNVFDTSEGFTANGYNTLQWAQDIVAKRWALRAD